MTSFVATPATIVNARLWGGVSKEYKDTWEEPDNANGDVTIVGPLPIDFVPSSILFASDALGAGTANVGLYKKNSDGTFTAVSAECFASDIAVTTAVAQTEVLFEAAATDIANTNKSLWQWAGLSARPDYAELFIALTFDTGTSSAGTIRLVVRGTE